VVKGHAWPRYALDSSPFIERKVTPQERRITPHVDPVLDQGPLSTPQAALDERETLPALENPGDTTPDLVAAPDHRQDDEIRTVSLEDEAYPGRRVANQGEDDPVDGRRRDERLAHVDSHAR
jgi:hypothetical protein